MIFIMGRTLTTVYSVVNISGADFLKFIRQNPEIRELLVENGKTY